MSESKNSVNKKVKEYLGMTTEPVGVTLIRKGVSPSDSSSTLPDLFLEKKETKGKEGQIERESFCWYVHQAASGKSFLIQQSEQSCNKAAIVLGLREPGFASIEPRIKDKVSTLRIGPTAGAEVVLLVLNPEQAMTLAHILPEIQMSFKNNRTVCGEGTARVLRDGKPVMSLLCIGARMDGGFRQNEMLAALPGATYAQLPARMNRLASLSRQAVEGLKSRLKKLQRGDNG